MELTPANLFRLANGLALLTWIALLASPARARWTPGVWRLSGRLVPLAFSLLYGLVLLTHWSGDGGFNSLEQVQVLFRNPWALLAGWVHYLAFDLFVGTWIAERAAQGKMPHLMIMPLLLLTFLFGPLGLLGFLLLRAAWQSTSLRQASGEGA